MVKQTKVKKKKIIIVPAAKPIISFKTKLKNEAPYLLLSLIIGFAFAFYLCGAMIINSSQINLPDGDVNAQFQILAMFRHDSWHWPLWYSQNILYPLGTYPNPPLLMVILKAMSPLFPKVFVYNGYLGVINSVLQFYVGFCLFRTIRNDKALAVLGACFLLGASFLVERYFRHFDLTCQWIILLAMLLTIKTPGENYKINFYWMLGLLFFTIGFAHPYIPFMIYTISVSQIFKLVYEKFGRFKLIQIILMFVIMNLVFLAGFYFFSYFSMGNTQGTGFGQNQTLLFGLFYPPFDTFFLNASPEIYYVSRYEGECYLGISIILLILAAITLYPKLIARHLSNKKYAAFILLTILMFVFSLSNRIFLLSTSPSFYIPLPNNNFIKQICSTLQSSGRFSWPLAYLLMFGSIILFYDYMKERKKLAYIILSALLLLQVFDLSKLYYQVHKSYFIDQQVPWDNDLHDEFWSKLDGKYKHLIVIDVDYRKFSYLAALNHMTINMFYLSRNDQSIQNLQQQLINEFLQNKLEEDSVYIISKRAYDARDINVNNAQCKFIDNYIVCSNEWK